MEIEREQSKELVTLHQIKKYYPITGGLLRRQVGTIKAVDDVDLTICRGETLGLVGESGCGKSTLGRVILRLEEPTQGEVFFEGQNLQSLSRQELHVLRRRMQIIFQDPYSSLNPRQTIGRTIVEGLVIHNVGTRAERRDRVRHVMETVGLSPEYIDRYPHEFSGGQRQRVGIARALILHPDLIVCDEPISALDVSIQAQIINLLLDLQEEFHLTYLFVSHDLSVVRRISDRVAVMYLGCIVELADKDELYAHPAHPYTRILLEAIPLPDPNVRKAHSNLDPDSRHSWNLPEGCRFHPRCPYAMPICSKEVPVFSEYAPRHWVRCFLYKDGILSSTSL